MNRMWISIAVLANTTAGDIRSKRLPNSAEMRFGSELLDC